jgi:hypothetical protein
MEPEADPAEAGEKGAAVAGEPSERERAVRASLLGLALGVALALLGRGRRPATRVANR